MKINNKKIIVSTLALAMGAALAGSISGSVAWYQYSTRATAQMSGTSAGSARNLQISSDAAAANDIDNAAWGYNVKPAAKAAVEPVAPTIADGVLVDDGFYSHPVYQYFNSWNSAANSNYFQYDLYLQAIDEDNAREGLDVYLTGYQLYVEDDDADLLNAIRVELVPYTYDGSAWEKGTAKILSYAGGTTYLSDYLDLNNNGKMDRDGFAADDSEGDIKAYKANIPVEGHSGDSGANLFTDAACTQAAPNPLTADGTYYKSSTASYDSVTFDSVKANDADPYNIVGTALTSTPNAEEKATKISVKVWLEGWSFTAKEHTPAADTVLTEGYYSDEECETSAAGATANGTTKYYTRNYIWNKASIGKEFNVDLRFAVKADH